MRLCLSLYYPWRSERHQQPAYGQKQLGGSGVDRTLLQWHSTAATGRQRGGSEGVALGFGRASAVS